MLLNELRYGPPEMIAEFRERMAACYVAMNNELCDADLRATNADYAQLAQEWTLEDLAGNYAFARWLCGGAP